MIHKVLLSIAFILILGGICIQELKAEELSEISNAQYVEVLTLHADAFNFIGNGGHKLDVQRAQVRIHLVSGAIMDDLIIDIAEFSVITSRISFTKDGIKLDARVVLD